MQIAVLELIAVLMFLLIILVYFLVKGYTIPVIERFRIAMGKGERKKRVETIVERAKISEPPYGRIALVLSIFALLMVLTLTHKLFFAVVTSDSMVPTFKRGDMFLAQALYIDPQPGDIVMFKRPDVYLPITHRVLKVENGRIYTGGDASGPDPWYITKKDIIAEAVLIGGKPVVIKDFGKYFILDARELRSIGPYGQEYLFYKNLVNAFKSYAMAIVIISISLYVYLEIGGGRRY
ncbi:signal peptidase I [Archaeoglobus veneficus]|uniref:Peptidase S24/S26A/S26B, conserved region n=1 Tax=Archaeoglobus veneficus (strain DSM 11195 / SNP6) TaxID=693661 RepID=F2KRA6_ARCVS|nr:signal peptidase I [Archaeoglobus veneficus]AEA47840.1 Peptidase S24/S26A/S26B, conserved region [Archaeoglobus veneficus SNP6]